MLSPDEKKQSVDAPSDARALKNSENSDWTGNGGFEGKPEEVNPQVRDKFDRLGAENGRYVAPLPANVGEVGPQVDISADRYLKGGSDQIEMLVKPRDRMDYIKLIDSRRIEE